MNDNDQPNDHPMRTKGIPRRVGGQWKGAIVIREPFDAVDTDLESLFYDGPIFPIDDKQS